MESVSTPDPVTSTDIKHKNMLDIHEMTKVAIYLLNNTYKSETEIEGIKVTANNIRTAKILANAIRENLSKIDASAIAQCLSVNQIEEFIIKLNEAKNFKVKEEEVIRILKDRGFDDAKIQKFLKS
jgi:hypothetical protein